MTSAACSVVAAETVFSVSCEVRLTKLMLIEDGRL
jgi:hypothetical protein